MKIIADLPPIREKLTEEIYLETGLDYKTINDVLDTIEQYLYSINVLEFSNW